MLKAKLKEHAQKKEQQAATEVVTAQQVISTPVVQPVYTPPPVQKVVQYVIPPEVEKEKVELQQGGYQKDARIVILEQENALLEHTVQTIEAEKVNLNAEIVALKLGVNTAVNELHLREQDIAQLKAANDLLKLQLDDSKHKIADKEEIIQVMKVAVHDLKTDKLELKEENRGLKKKEEMKVHDISMIEHDESKFDFLQSDIDINVSGENAEHNESFAEII